MFLTHTHTLLRAPGRRESSSSSEVERKPIGQIRFCHFLTELSINLERCTVIRCDLGLSQCSVWECSERLLIRPGGHGAYDDITQPLSLYTRPSVFCACLPPNLPSPLPFIPSQLQGDEVAPTAQTDAYLTWPLSGIYVHWFNPVPTVPSKCWPNTTTRGPFCIKCDPFSPFFLLNRYSNRCRFCIADCIPTSILILCTHTYMNVP